MINHRKMGWVRIWTSRLDPENCFFLPTGLFSQTPKLIYAPGNGVDDTSYPKISQLYDNSGIRNQKVREDSFQKALTIKLKIFKDVPSQPDQQSREGSS